jgi:hypothetical protein
MSAAPGALALLAAVAVTPTAARADGAAGGWGWGAVPFANYDSDAGFGIGGIGTLTLHRPGVHPYRASLLLQVAATSERVQAHELRWDLVVPRAPRLRLYGRATLFSSVNSTYCGVGNGARCDPAAPRHYHHMRFYSPTLQVGARWRGRRPALSTFVQWRVFVYRVGSLTDAGTYPDSLYELDHPGGEPGVASVPQAGVMYDTRDSEGTPSRGVWAEASVRGAARATGSDWRFAGANVTTRVYQRLARGLVAATRLVTDVAAGDLPVIELGLINAAEIYPAFGGQTGGRGIRERHFIGRIKLLAQQELRLDLSRRWVAVPFVDAGWVAADWDDVGGDPGTIHWSGGAGLRYVSSSTFILRADLGVSPVEDWSPQLYLYLGHLY